MIKSIFYSKFFIVICATALLYTSGYALSTVYKIRIYIEILFANIFLLPIILIHWKQKISLYTISYILLIFMITITYIASGFNSLPTYISYICIITFAFGITTVYKFNDFIRIFLKLMVIISIISLVGHLTLNLGILTLPLMENSNSIVYGIGYVFFYFLLLPERNTGIFWEPGLFASFLVIALVFELLYKKGKISSIRIILFIVTLITTKSSAGYGLLLFLLALYLIKKASSLKNKKISNFVSIYVFIISILFLFNYPIIFDLIGLDDNEVTNKLLGEQLKDQTRILAINHNFDLFLLSPLVGLGIGQVAKNIRYVADTSTSTFVLSIFGILGIQYTIYWIRGILRNNENNIFVNIMVCIIFLFILNKEPHLSNVFTWCIMFYFLKHTTKFKSLS